MGGLVALNTGTVENSYLTGSVSGSTVGGLIGRNVNDGTVERSYATGTVSGDDEVGGLVGINPEATVRESYAIGSVNGDGDVGGLVGGGGTVFDDGNVTNSYWDTETTGQPTSDGNGTGLTTSEMTGSAVTNNMMGFDFTTTWETVTNPDDYPILAFQTEDDPAPANFEVSVSSNLPVTEGDTVQITATPTNTGGQQDTQDITASASGFGSFTRTVTLNAGESTTETVPIPTSPGDEGTYTVVVESENDTATTTVIVEPEGGDDTFTDPLPGFNNPPQNTGALDPALYEDIDGDGDGTAPSQTVNLWSELVVNPQNFNSLTQEQVDALDWNGDGQLTPSDAVSLWTEQVLA